MNPAIESSSGLILYPQSRCNLGFHRFSKAAASCAPPPFHRPIDTKANGASLSGGRFPSLPRRFYQPDLPALLLFAELDGLKL